MKTHRSFLNDPGRPAARKILELGENKAMTGTRIVLAILTGLAVVWMMVPQVHSQGTEIGFAPGTPDPNVYKTSYLMGWPLPWGCWERSVNEAAGYDESGFGPLHPLNFALHILAILVPLLLLSCRRLFRWWPVSMVGCPTDCNVTNK